MSSRPNVHQRRVVKLQAEVKRLNDEVGATLNRLQAAHEERDAALAEAEKLREALRVQDPRNAAERYDRIADDFHRETGLWPPGRSRPAAMGPDPEAERAGREWRKFCNDWHERFFDAALATSAPKKGETVIRFANGSTMTASPPGDDPLRGVREGRRDGAGNPWDGDPYTWRCPHGKVGPVYCADCTRDAIDRVMAQREKKT